MRKLLAYCLTPFFEAPPVIRWTRFVLLACALFSVGFLFENREWFMECGELEMGGTTERLHRAGRVGTWFGMAGIAVFSTGLLFTSGWWLRKYDPPTDPLRCGSEELAERWFWCLLLTATLLAGSLSWSRMDKSVYNDEEYSLRTYIRGRFQKDDDGLPQFRPVTWAHTVWANPLGNNHILFSVLSRVSLETWQKFSGKSQTAFSETAFRFPSWIGGMGGILMLGLLLRYSGYARAAIFAVFLAAVHPWYLRYMAEGRGYGLMFLFLPLGWYFAARGIREGKRRWWFFYALAQVALLASYAGALYVVAIQNIALWLFLIWEWLLHRRPWLPLARLCAANALSIIGLCLFKGPWIIFQLQHLARDRMNTRVGSDYLENFWAYLSAGMMLHSDDPANPIHITITRLNEAGWPADFIVWKILPLLLLAGVLRLLLAKRNGWLIAALFVLPAPLGYLHAWFSQTYLFIWYLLFALTGYVALLGLALSWPLRAIRQRVTREAATLALLVAAIGSFAFFTWPQTRVIRAYSKENTRDAVAFARGGDVDPAGEKPVETLIGAFWTEASFYDPRIEWLPRVANFVPLLNRAFHEKRDLYLIYGNLDSALKHNPGNFIFINNPALFTEVKQFPGLETGITTLRILRYTGADPAPHIPDPIPER